jgi:hypothetical protein
MPALSATIVSVPRLTIGPPESPASSAQSCRQPWFPFHARSKCTEQAGSIICRPVE